MIIPKNTHTLIFLELCQYLLAYVDLFWQDVGDVVYGGSETQVFCASAKSDSAICHRASLPCLSLAIILSVPVNDNNGFR